MYAIYIRACVCVYVRGELARSFQELYFIQARVCTLRIPQNSQNCSRISICYIGTEIPQWTPSLKCGAWIIFTIRTLLSSFLLMYKKKREGFSQQRSHEKISHHRICTLLFFSHFAKLFEKLCLRTNQRSLFLFSLISTLFDFYTLISFAFRFIPLHRL